MPLVTLCRRPPLSFILIPYPYPPYPLSLSLLLVPKELRFLQYFSAFPLVFLRFPVSPVASHPLPAAVRARCSYRFLQYFKLRAGIPATRRRSTSPLCGRLAKFYTVPCKYAVKVDGDVATLRPFGQILYRPVHWLSKTNIIFRHFNRTANGNRTVNGP